MLQLVLLCNYSSCVCQGTMPTLREILEAVPYRAGELTGHAIFVVVQGTWLHANGTQRVWNVGTTKDMFNAMLSRTENFKDTGRTRPDKSKLWIMTNVPPAAAPVVVLPAVVVPVLGGA